MIYKNEDGSIYKIEKIDREIVIGDLEATEYRRITAIENSVYEIIEVLNYLLKKQRKEEKKS